MKSISKTTKGGDTVKDFEMLLRENMVPLQRYVHFKIHHWQDAEDIIQEVCLAATVNLFTLSKTLERTASRK